MIYASRLDAEKNYIIEKICAPPAPVDIEELARALGLSIVTHSEMSENGYIFYESSEDSFTIFVNGSQSKAKQRFTIAHEIGHYLLHKNYIIQNTFLDRGTRSGYIDEKEAEADKFASSILMPIDLINQEIDRGLKTIALLAEKLEVSEEALKNRLNVK